ncbi:MAG: hypothetical protein QF473_41210, partial [Planctomycetota bacterium]|nr:hypothetical protein [Planctomycetota bacterium]
TATNTWNQEGRIVRSVAPKQQGPVIQVHIQKDGRIKIADQVADTPGGLTTIASELIKDEPSRKYSRIVLNVYRQTPSIMTSDVCRALDAAGLDSENLILRFTEE